VDSDPLEGSQTMGRSRTARAAATHRAYHLMRDRPAILEDSAANWLIDPPLSVILRVAPLRWLFFGRLLARFRPIRAFVVVRSRYAEDCLGRSIGEGCRQYVILGAGLDSWALRHERPGISVFELDHLETQESKEARMRARLGTVPPHLSLIPIDLERESIAEVLNGAPFDPDSRVFVSWLVTIYYLTRGAIAATFASLAKVCAPGSRVVFDYFQPKSAMSPADFQLFEKWIEEEPVVGSRCGHSWSQMRWPKCWTQPDSASLRTCRHLRSGTAIFLIVRTGSISPGLCGCAVLKVKAPPESIAWSVREQY